jgi:hypothetical protein
VESLNLIREAARAIVLGALGLLLLPFVALLAIAVAFLDSPEIEDVRQDH